MSRAASHAKYLVEVTRQHKLRHEAGGAARGAAWSTSYSTRTGSGRGSARFAARLGSRRGLAPFSFFLEVSQVDKFISIHFRCIYCVVFIIRPKLIKNIKLKTINISRMSKKHMKQGQFRITDRLPLLSLFCSHYENKYTLAETC